MKNVCRPWSRKKWRLIDRVVLLGSRGHSNVLEESSGLTVHNTHIYSQLKKHPDRPNTLIVPDAQRGFILWAQGPPRTALNPPRIPVKENAIPQTSQCAAPCLRIKTTHEGEQENKTLNQSDEI